MLMDEGLDTGPILQQRELALAPDETGGSLLARLAPIGAGLLLETLDGLVRGSVRPRPQDEAAATLAPPIRKADAALDWNATAAELECRVRAFAPSPSAFTGFPGRDGPTLLRIHAAAVGPRPSSPRVPGAFRRTGSRRRPGLEIACADGVLAPLEVQTSGSRRMEIADFLRGDRLPGGPDREEDLPFLSAADAAELLGPARPPEIPPERGAWRPRREANRADAAERPDS